MKKNLILFLICVFSLGLIGCNSANANKLDILTVGMDVDNSPFVSKNKSSINDSDNEYDGFDIDFMKLLQEELKVKFEIIPKPRIGLIPGLKSSEYDIVISGLSSEEALSSSSKINITKKYYEIEDVVLFRKGNKTLNTIEDLNDKIVGVQRNSTQYNELINAQNQDILPKDIIEYDSIYQAITDMQNGKIEAVIVDKLFATSHDFEDIIQLEQALSKQNIIIATDESNVELSDRLNNAVNTVVNSDNFKDVVEKWFR